MQNPAIGAKDLLVLAGVALHNAGDWPIILGRQPKDKDQCIVINVSGGNPPMPKWRWDEPSFQVLVRGQPNGYVAAYDKATEVKNALHSLPPQTVGPDRWVLCNMVGDITFLGYDERDRPEFSLNFQLVVEPAAAPGDHREELGLD